MLIYAFTTKNIFLLNFIEEIAFKIYYIFKVRLIVSSDLERRN